MLGVSQSQLLMAFSARQLSAAEGRDLAKTRRIQAESQSSNLLWLLGQSEQTAVI